MRISDWSSDVCSSDLGLPVYRLAAVERGWHTPPLPTLSPEGERTLGRFPPPSRHFAASNPFFPGRHSPGMEFVHAAWGPVPKEVGPGPARHPPPASPHRPSHKARLPSDRQRQIARTHVGTPRT